MSQPAYTEAPFQQRKNDQKRHHVKSRPYLFNIGSKGLRATFREVAVISGFREKKDQRFHQSLSVKALSFHGDSVK